MNHEKWLYDILEKINKYKEYVPVGNKRLETIDYNNPDPRCLLQALINLFKDEDNKIKKDYLNPFITFSYEYGVMDFAKLLIESMISQHEYLKNYEDYRVLLKQKYIAYGFYSTFSNNSPDHSLVLNDNTFKKTLYLGLVEFYNNFYGQFSDNELAIKLLCTFYPNNIDLKNQVQQVVKAIYNHIVNAGTPNDLGFAYKGIKIIEQYINRLPLYVVDSLLKQYEIFRIINDKVYRCQIFTIIKYSKIKKHDKYLYKFFYLDSLLLSNYLNYFLYEKYKNEYENLNRHYYHTDLNLSVDKIIVFESKNTNNLLIYWTNELSHVRALVINGNPIIKVEFNESIYSIHIEYLENSSIRIDFSFSYDDWLLDCYTTKKLEKKFKDFVFKQTTNIEYNDLTFSLLYLNNYRGLYKQVINFDHQFDFDLDKGLYKNNVYPDIPHFYGRNINSVSCIVGKNGTGKTSTVDFLRESFFKLLLLIDHSQITYNNDGYVDKKDYLNFGFLEGDSEFLIVFHLGKKAFFLTNIETSTELCVQPFYKGAYKSVNELSKVVYFSNKLSIQQDSFFIDDSSNINKSRDSRKSISNVLNNFRQADYSEEESLLKRLRAKNTLNSNNKVDIINEDICYQLAFLNHLTPKKLEEYFDIPKDTQFTLSSSLLDKNKFTFSLRYLHENMKNKICNTLIPFLYAPDSKIEYFSSGQYAKFSFLSKLYWFLEGYSDNIELFKQTVGDNVFSVNDILLENENALIFIDEGELYYHPEWQRNYLKILIDEINNPKNNSKVQVVITTNSPFIISDILKEDITYLSKNKNDINADLTFGQNIHKLLKENFFMSYTIGEYSREVIDKIISWIHMSSEKENSLLEELKWYFGDNINPENVCASIKLLIEQIGEPVYRNKLLEMLTESPICNTSETIAELEKEIEAKQNKLKQLKKQVNHDD